MKGSAFLARIPRYITAISAQRKGKGIESVDGTAMIQRKGDGVDKVDGTISIQLQSKHTRMKRILMLRRAKTTKIRKSSIRASTL